MARCNQLTALPFEGLMSRTRIHSVEVDG